MQNYNGDKDNLGKCEQVSGVLPFVAFNSFFPLKATFVRMTCLALMEQ